jgi:hypothetical protein
MNYRNQISALLIAAACALAMVFTALFFCFLPNSPKTVAKRDFITYWATGQQLARHGNPYDPAAINRIESEAGFQGGTAYFMRNTPWTLPLALPLGYSNLLAATMIWSLAMLGLLMVSVHTIWKALGEQGNRLDWLGYCFPPALYCVILGQTSILPLLGLMLFLHLNKTHPFAAGAALWFCTIKPHLLLPFALVVLIWIVFSRSYRVLAGAVTTFAAGVLITTWIDPSAWSQYAYYMRTSVVTHEFTPCLGDLLRDSLHPSAEVLAFVPAALGCVWAVVYFWRCRHCWDWLEHGGLLVLVSLLVAPFGWIFDQALAIPAILFAVSRNVSQAVLAILALLYLLIEIQIVSPFDLHSPAYLWPAPAWLLWYLLARAAARRQATYRNFSVVA